MAVTEKSIGDLEIDMAKLAGNAFRLAREQAMLTSGSVVEAQGNALYRVYADGSREFIKELPPPLAVQPGAVYKLR
jgi:hypothetical protein